MNQTKIKPISKEYKSINDKMINSNNGNFDIIQFRNNVYSGHSRTRREAGCSQDSTYSSSNIIAEDIAFMFIPTDFWGKKNDNPTKEEVSKIQEDLKAWIQFGKTIGIRTEFLGVFTPTNFYKEKNLKNLPSWTKNITDCFVVSWDTRDLVSPKHGLGTLSFIRYFYSPLSNSIYMKTVELANKYPKLRPLELFWAGHMFGAGKAYDPYYGFYVVPNIFRQNDCDSFEEDDDGEEISYSNVTELCGIKSYSSLHNDYVQGKNLNAVWTQIVSVPIISKKITREEFNKMFSANISDFMWKKMVEIKKDHIEGIPLDNDNVLYGDQIVLYFNKKDKEGKLDEVIRSMKFLEI
jgi:hypothetical protein